MAASKYLNLEEAASQLGISADELKKLRERGDIRGFADRGTWKFKFDDVMDLVRKRQADSDPEVPLMPLGDDASEDASADENFLLESDTFNLDQSGESDSDVRLMGSSDDFPVAPGESDVNLLGLDSDSDIKLTTGDEADKTVAGVVVPPSDGDSDVRLLDDDSDSDVKLVGDDSDSDVKLIGDDSDSDVKLIDGDKGDAPSVEGETILETNLVKDKPDLDETDNLMVLDDDDAGDVQLIKDGSSVFGSSASALDDERAGEDESGISIAGDSSLMLNDDSGISLDAPLSADDDEEEEGITLSLDDDSGISLDADSGISLDTGDSGISLESVGDSGISLEEDNFTGTVPMMDALDEESVPATQFEIPSLADESSYELDLDDSADTGVLNVASSGSAELDDAVFDVDEDDSVAEFDAEEDLDLEEDAFEDEEMGVFDAADDDVFASDEEDEFSPRRRVGAMAGAEVEWGTGVITALGFSTVLMVVLGIVMMDLVLNTATSSSTNVISTPLLQTIGGLVK